MVRVKSEEILPKIKKLNEIIKQKEFNAQIFEHNLLMRITDLGPFDENTRLWMGRISRALQIWLLDDSMAANQNEEVM